MNRRRRFLAKRKRTVTRKLADMMSAAHLNASERVTFLNLYRCVITMDAALRYPYLRHYQGV